MRGPDYKGDMAAIHSSLKKCLDLMFNAMYECVDEDAKHYAQDCVDGIETWIENCKRKGGIESSIQGQERAIQAIMDEYGCTREEAIDIMNGEVTSGCHSKAKK